MWSSKWKATSGGLDCRCVVLLLLFGTRLDVCYGHSTPVTATQSLRLIGGRSPGSQDSRRPRHPLSPRRRRTLHRRGLQKLNSRKLRTAGKVCRYRGLAGENCPNFHMKLFSNRSIYCATSPVHKRRAGCRINFRI